MARRRGARRDVARCHRGTFGVGGVAGNAAAAAAGAMVVNVTINGGTFTNEQSIHDLAHG
jgi:hypothetical protein